MWLEPYLPQIEVMAEAWLAAGARGISVWSEGRALAWWPADALDQPATMEEMVRFGTCIFGSLVIAGVSGAAARARLRADALLLARLAHQESELEEMTSELIVSQDQLLAFYDLTRTTRRRLQLNELLTALASEAIRLMNIHASFIWLGPVTGKPRLVQSPENIFDERALAETLRQITFHTEETIGTLDLPFLDGTRSALETIFAPILIRNTVIAGLLGFVAKSSGPFHSSDRKLARAIAAHTSSQIETALLYEESLDRVRINAEMDLARKVQMQLLPRHFPLVSGLDVAAFSRPALEVGGDFYDIVSLPGAAFNVVVGDIAGKGIAAALLVGLTRTAVRTAVRALPAFDVVGAISSANDEIFHDFTEIGTFATLFVGAYDPDVRAVFFANAGHSPVIYRPSGGTAYLLEADAPPVGVLPKCLCERHSIPFGPGDVLVIATDGFSEARDADGVMFGYDRLLELVDHYAHVPAADIAGTLFATIDRFGAGHSQDDDRTVVVLRGL